MTKRGTNSPCKASPDFPIGPIVASARNSFKRRRLCSSRRAPANRLPARPKPHHFFIAQHHIVRHSINERNAFVPAEFTSTKNAGAGPSIDEHCPLITEPAFEEADVLTGFGRIGNGPSHSSMFWLRGISNNVSDITRSFFVSGSLRVIQECSENHFPPSKPRSNCGLCVCKMRISRTRPIVD